MDFKLFFKPKQFISSFTDKLSWELLFILLFSIVANLITIILIVDIETIRSALLIMGGYPLDTFLPIQTIVKSLILIGLMALPFKIFKVGILTFIFKYILKIFKINISYLRLINLYMYSKIAANMFIFFSFIFITESGKNALISLAISNVNAIQYLKLLYSNENSISALFSIASILIFYGLIIYGIKISVKNKIAPIK